MAGNGPATDGPSERRNLTVGLLYGAAVIAVFSSFVLISRIGMRTDLQPNDLMALRFGVGGLILLPVFLLHGLAGLRIGDALALAALSGLGFAMLAYGGIARTPATHGTVFLHGTLPLSTILIVAAYSQRWPSHQRLIGVLAIAAGVLAMALDSAAYAGSSQLTGDVMLFAAATSWSAYSVWVRVRKIPALQAAAIVTVMSGIVYIPVYVAMSDRGLLQASLGDLIVQGIFQGIIIGVVSIFVYTRAVTLLGPTSTALLSTTVPALTALLAIPLLGEYPSTLVICGIALTTAGMIVALTARMNEEL